MASSQTALPPVQSQGAVLRFNGITGAFIDAFVPLGSGGLRAPTALIFGPDGNLYVSDYGDHNIKRYNRTSGQFMGVFTSGGNPVLPQGLQFGPDGNLYLADEHQILRYNGSTGAFMDVFVPNGTGNLNQPQGIVFGPDGNLYATNFPLQEVLRFNGATGAFIDTFVSQGSGGLNLPTSIEFGPDGNLYVGDQDGGQILRYNGTTGAFLNVFVPAGTGGLAGSTEALSYITFQNVATAVLNGTFSDDGLPAGSTLTATWTKVSGPGPVMFSATTFSVANVRSQSNSAKTTAGLTLAGTYVLRLIASDSQQSSTSDVTITVNPPQQSSVIAAVNPNVGQQGQQNLSVTITGRNTHFAQGTTQASFGAGVTVASLTVKSPTSATAVLNIDLTATVGLRIVTMTTGSETESLTNGFNVVALSTIPTITTVSPNSGQQGQNGPVTIVGQNTHFVQGTTKVDMGPGITVSAVTVTCPTCLSAHVSIADNAPTGPHNVTVTTGTEVASLAGGFTVQPGTPILTSLVPDSGQQGQNLLIAVTGKFTHFAQSSTQVSLGAGITVKSVSVSRATSLTAQLAIDANAAPGTRTLTVTTGAEVVSVQNVFTVQAAPPVIVAVNPNSGAVGQQNLPIAITGQFTHFAQGTTQVSFGAGITVSSVTVASASGLTAQISIAANAVVGARTVTVTTGSEIVSLSNGFTVTVGTPTILSVNPTGGQQGQQNLSVAITGQFTHFAQSTTTANFGAGITIASLTVQSLISATAVVDIDPAAATGARTVTLTTGGEVATLPNAFTVSGGTPVLVSIDPNIGQQGQQNLSVNITGAFTHFAQGTTTASFGAGISVASLTVNSSTTATAVVNIAAGATTGPRAVTLTTGTEVETLSNGFTVTASTPVLLAVNPKSGQQGQQNLSVAIAGQFTHFAQASTQVSFGAGITVSSVAVASATSLTAQINIAANANSGPTTVSVTTGTEVVSLSNGFTVTSGPAALVSVVPNSGQQGQQSIPVAITGQNTHFVQGTTQVSFGSGISVGSIAVAAATSLTAQISIAATATGGPRTVVATTGAEVASLANGFTVQAAAGSSLSVSPNFGVQGKIVTVAITGRNTNFVQGMTVASFGPSIMVGTKYAGDFGPVTVTSPTTATAQLTILSFALPGFRTVAVETGTEQVNAPNAFQVLGAPGLLGVSPNSAKRAQTVPVMIVGSFTNFVQGTTQASFGPGISVGGGFGPVTVNNAVSASAQVTITSGATLGPRTVIAQTGAEVASAANVFSVLGPVTGGPPTVTITSPTEATEVTAPITVTGTVSSPNLDNWTLDYQAPGASSFTTFATGTTSSVSGTFDPTLLLNGNAVIRLSATDTSGQAATPTTVTVVVTRNLKIGNFTVSFNDLTIPEAGLPIQIVRTYDSRNKSVGDFGVGWTLDLKTVNLSTNFPIGSEWTGTVTGGGFVPNYCIVPTQPHVVTVALPDGTTYEFQPVLSPNSGC